MRLLLNESGCSYVNDVALNPGVLSGCMRGMLAVGNGSMEPYRALEHFLSQNPDFVSGGGSLREAGRSYAVSA